MPKGLEAKKKCCVGGVTSKDFKKKWDGNLRYMESICRDILLEQLCKKLFYSMNCFWEGILDVDVDIGWLRLEIVLIRLRESKLKLSGKN